jgi:hypothetical protein
MSEKAKVHGATTWLALVGLTFGADFARDVLKTVVPAQAGTQF